MNEKCVFHVTGAAISFCPPLSSLSFSFIFSTLLITYFASQSPTCEAKNMLSSMSVAYIFYKTNKKSYFFSVVEFSGQARGVLREVWYNLNDFDLNRVVTMREHSVFNSPPESQIILRDFDAPVDIAEKYVQRLTSYLQVNPRFTLKTCS